MASSLYNLQPRNRYWIIKQESRTEFQYELVATVQLLPNTKLSKTPVGCTGRFPRTLQTSNRQKRSRRTSISLQETIGDYKSLTDQFT
nr:hypothetical protein Itr_chr06CG18030 [Ipomoea trifida]